MYFSALDTYCSKFDLDCSKSTFSTLNKFNWVIFLNAMILTVCQNIGCNIISDIYMSYYLTRLIFVFHLMCIRDSDFKNCFIPYSI